jgi:hypothetical protein
LGAVVRVEAHDTTALDEFRSSGGAIGGVSLLL